MAAMERELAPLVRGWKKGVIVSNEKKFTMFEREGVLAVVCGIGSQNAALAARAAVDQFHPAVLISVGLAGALIRSLKVGSVFTPSVVVGLRAIPAKGEPFDPHLHQAVEMVDTKEAEDHHVLEELQRGYKLKDRLLRPSMVKVANNPKR